MISWVVFAIVLVIGVAVVVARASAEVSDQENERRERAGRRWCASLRRCGYPTGRRYLTEHGKLVVLVGESPDGSKAVVTFGRVPRQVWRLVREHGDDAAPIFRS